MHGHGCRQTMREDEKDSAGVIHCIPQQKPGG